MPKTRQAKRAPSPRVTPRIRRTPEEARRVLLESAERIVIERGPDALTLKAVAKGAGVTHALVTHYFGTVDNLIAEVIAHRTRLMVSELFDRMTLSDPVATRHELLDRLFITLRDKGHARLLTWVQLTGRANSSLLGKVHGLRLAADALEGFSQQFAAAQGLVAPRRDEVELVVMVGMCASLWFALAGDNMLKIMGRPAGTAGEEWFKAGLAAMLQRVLDEPALGTQPP